MAIIHSAEPGAKVAPHAKAMPTLQMIMSRAQQKVQQASNDITMATMVEAFNAGYSAGRADEKEAAEQARKESE